jgi:hypothetical protein
MTISKRRASTVYNRFNFTITDVTDLSAPSPVQYHTDDFFVFYDILFAIDQNQADWPKSTQFTFLGSIAGFLGKLEFNQIDTGEGAQQLRLQEFLATPIALYTNAWRGEPAGPDMGKSLALAVPSYRVCYSKQALICSW